MNDSLIRLLFLAHVASTLFMLGVIWLVQFVHYPLFAHVGNKEFPSYERRHTRLITLIVAPLMLIEGTTAVFLLLLRPPSVAAWTLWAGAALLGATWLSTAMVQMPCHEVLSRGFDPMVHNRLVWSNWFRTAAWSLRGALVLWMAWSFVLPSETGVTTEGSAKMARVQVGDRAPDFSATTHDGKKISLADYLGKRALVVFFYPKDGTPICTQEACAFRDSYEQFIDAGADVIGVSGDNAESHGAFARQHKLSFPLISDADGKLRKAFGVPKTMGIFPGRVTYVIDQAGIIKQVFSAQFASDEHVRQALIAVGAATRSSQ